jgi:hypothetical protein
MKNKITIFAKIKILYMIEIDKKLHKDIKEYCQLNGIVMKDFVNKLLKKAFMVEKYGEKPFTSNEVVSIPYVSNLEVTLEGPADLPPITNEKVLEKFTKPTEEIITEEIKEIKKSKKRKL